MAILSAPDAPGNTASDRAAQANRGFSECPSHSTPWGASQHVDHIAPGIIFHGTAGHGGLHLSRPRATHLHKLFEPFEPFTSTWAWLEEDCDYVLAILAWPELWAPERVRRVAPMVLGMRKPRNDGRRGYFASLPESYFASPQWAKLEALAANGGVS